MDVGQTLVGGLLEAGSTFKMIALLYLVLLWHRFHRGEWMLVRVARAHGFEACRTAAEGHHVLLLHFMLNPINL